MCLPWNHKWERIDHEEIEVYDYYESEEYPIYRRHVITQRCTHCGKEIVRKYRV